MASERGYRMLTPISPFFWGRSDAGIAFPGSRSRRILCSTGIWSKDQMVRMRIRISLFVTGLLIATGASLGYGQGVSVNESLKNGTDAIRSGHAQEAETYFKAALQADPQNPQALMGLGVSELRLGKPEEALNLLQRAAAHDPAPGGAFLFLGIAYAQMHRVDDCVAALHREVE